MRSSLREKMKNGPVIGTQLNFNSPWFVDMVGLIGMDYFIVDAEHGPLTPESGEGLIRAAEAWSVSAVVRVPSNTEHEILRFADIGAVGIQIPHVESGEQARRAVESVRYPPYGHRGFAMVTRAAGYGFTMKAADHIANVNNDMLVLAMVENERGVQNIDDIIGTEGVDVIVIGPGDLAMSLGGNPDRSRPEVVRAIDHVIDRCIAKNKWFSLPSNAAPGMKDAFARGARMIQMGTADWVVEAGRQIMRDARSPDTKRQQA